MTNNNNNTLKLKGRQLTKGRLISDAFNYENYDFLLCAKLMYKPWSRGISSNTARKNEIAKLGPEGRSL